LYYIIKQHAIQVQPCQKKTVTPSSGARCHYSTAARHACQCVRARVTVECTHAQTEDSNLNRIIHMHLIAGERWVFSWLADRCNEFSSCVAASSFAGDILIGNSQGEETMWARAWILLN